ncbi:hypothetical protein E2C01_029173 [Portunus trituberculatus]|uniref:Uncharacterized protein n=1 Tax=Portunus trituberculatus TaxID=210409 RepID=A0A5B7ERJ4_PORTR|nr:hypothetical protein [Portunus trituberculatus]
MNKALAKKRSVEAISEEHTFTASPVDSKDVCLAAGQPRETVAHRRRGTRRTRVELTLVAMGMFTPGTMLGETFAVVEAD